MENEKVKHSGVPDSVSKHEDLGDGSKADVGQKTTGNVAGGLSEKRHLPTQPVDEKIDIDINKQNETVSEPEMETQSPGSEVDEQEAEQAQTPPEAISD